MKKILILFLSVWSVSTTAQTIENSETSMDSNDPVFNVNGYLDAYYLYNFNQPATNTTTSRVADVRTNSIAFGLVQTVLQYQHEDFRVVADLTFGPNAYVFNYGNIADGELAVMIKQAFIEFPIIENLKMTVGQYGTHMGLEAFEPYENANYSYSYQFETGPNYHTGAKLDYQLNDDYSLMFGIVNGWDQLSDYNNSKSITAQVSGTPIDGMNLALSWIGGDEGGGPANLGVFEGAYTSFFDLVGRYKLSEQIKFAMNAGYGFFKASNNSFPSEQDGEWWAIAGYAEIGITENSRLGIRAEHLNDPERLRKDVEKISSITATFNYLMNDHIIFKPEFRVDWANFAIFPNDGGFIENQTTLGVAIIGRF